MVVFKSLFDDFSDGVISNVGAGFDTAAVDHPANGGMNELVPVSDSGISVCKQVRDAYGS